MSVIMACARSTRPMQPISTSTPSQPLPSPVQLARAQPRQQEGERHVERGGHARAVVQWQPASAGPERRSAAVRKKIGGFSMNGSPAERGHDPVAGLQDVIDQTEAVGLVGLPGIAADQARKDPQRAQHDDEQQRVAQDDVALALCCAIGGLGYRKHVWSLRREVASARVVSRVPVRERRRSAARAAHAVRPPAGTSVALRPTGRTYGCVRQPCQRRNCAAV